MSDRETILSVCDAVVAEFRQSIIKSPAPLASHISSFSVYDDRFPFFKLLKENYFFRFRATFANYKEIEFKRKRFEA